MNDVIQWGHLFGHLMQSLLVFPVWPRVCPGPVLFLATKLKCAHSECHISVLARFFPDVPLGIGARPLSTQFDQFSEHSLVSLWPCWLGPCFLDLAQASRCCWRGLVWTSTPTLGVLQPPTHFPLSWWQLVWPLKTEQNNVKIDKLHLACAEPVWLFQSGTDRISADQLVCETGLIQHATDYNTNIKARLCNIC